MCGLRGCRAGQAVAGCLPTTDQGGGGPGWELRHDRRASLPHSATYAPVVPINHASCSCPAGLPGRPCHACAVPQRRQQPGGGHWVAGGAPGEPEGRRGASFKPVAGGCIELITGHQLPCAPHVCRPVALSALVPPQGDADLDEPLMVPKVGVWDHPCLWLSFLLDSRCMPAGSNAFLH